MQSKNSGLSKIKVILLDVYETLLDMSDIERKVNSIFESKRGYTIWFELFMQYCFVDNSIKRFNGFSSIAKATLQMTGQALGREIREEDFENILEQLKHLPIHDGVQKGLSRLNDYGFRVGALTNSPEKIVSDRMERTGLVSYFEKVLSAEHIRKYKPHIDVYHWAAKEMQADSSETILVSAHGWDIAGASSAGMHTAYIKQKRQMLYPLAPAPDIYCQDLVDLADQLKNSLTDSHST